MQRHRATDGPFIQTATDSAEEPATFAMVDQTHLCFGTSSWGFFSDTVMDFFSIIQRDTVRQHIGKANTPAAENNLTDVSSLFTKQTLIFFKQHCSGKVNCIMKYLGLIFLYVSFNGTEIFKCTATVLIEFPLTSLTCQTDSRSV